MALPEVRRSSDPRIVRKLHSAIKKICEQKQSPIFERIFKALTIDKVQVTRSRVELQLKNSVDDGLIVESGFGKGGIANKVLVPSYRTPSIETFYENYKDDAHDWYCWVCHREGEVCLCSSCPRVIHKKCAESISEDLDENFVCYCCKDLQSTKSYGKKELDELSTMLKYTIRRMKSKCEELWKTPTVEEEPTYKLFVYKDTNLLDLEKRVKKKEFDSLAKFHYEIEWLFHNAVIFYGGDHKLATLARVVVLDGQNELSQIDICSDCYIMSNERPLHWYSHPCKTPHKIVYAKLGSDPHWPAKVLRENEDGSSIDVRFFGPPYQRAWIPLRNVLELKDKPVNKKRSKSLMEAEKELKIYLKILKKYQNDKKFHHKSISDESDSVEEEISDNKEILDQCLKKRKSLHENENLDQCLKKKKSSDENKNQCLKKRKSSLCSTNKEDDEQFPKTKKKKSIKSNFFSKDETKKNLMCSSMKPLCTSVKEKSYDAENSDICNEILNDQFAQQIKMTDDYKMITKLQEQINKYESTVSQLRFDYETAQTNLESVRLDLAIEKQKTVKFQEELEKGNEIGIENIKNNILLKKKDELDAALQEERRKNEENLKICLNEAVTKEKANAEAHLQEVLEKERILHDEKLKGLQRTFDRYKIEWELKHSRALEESRRKLKHEFDDLMQRTLQESAHLHQSELEHHVAATKKKSWCSNCSKEAFYHCCWNTNYCTTECQRIHWSTHRYQCTRDLTNTCRSCQQRQNFTSVNYAPQAPK
ncbi:zinc finger MYND domain-containing protein 11 isoform X1 [Hydra vulgaris]|uniref:zinc finger MYND domain-containing protein 11 isoform X1 n=1 Tax=Hydra vulgaris TaxID=6087 RepID=UPI00064130A8|nr:zinc finger MYND domain-containing protein 11 [Hydra vulgaris]XP_047143534.1 zinc finger MYND domain-containing protein 11 [Hydra vulgaris]